MSQGYDKTCPRCGGKTDAEYCDVGVGYVQIEPYHCDDCGWVEGGCLAEKCRGSRCMAWDYCQGKSIVTDLEVEP